MKAVTVLLAVLIVVVSLPAAAQTEGRDPRQHSPSVAKSQNRTPRFDAWLRGQALLYDNFFQAYEGEPSEEVLAGLGEIGARYRISDTVPMRVYGMLNYLSYDEEGLSVSPGVRVGIEREARPHGFDLRAEYLTDRPSFDVGDEYDRADIRTLSGEYFFRFLEDWQLSLDGELQKQDYDLSPDRENEFGSLGAAIRFRGWRRFSPEIGFRSGNRDVVDDRQSYDQDETYLQIRSSITPDLYLSVRLRDRQRDYTTDNFATDYFGREDERQQISASADWSMTENWVLNLYASREEVETNLEGRDFDTSLFVGGLTYKF